MRSIDPYQMKRIYAIGHQLSLVGHDHEDELHALVATITGKESVKLPGSGICNCQAYAAAGRAGPSKAPARTGTSIEAWRGNKRPAEEDMGLDV